MKFLDELAARRRFGMRLGLDSIRALCGELGNPERTFKAVHIAGTNGKGAVAAMLDACLASAARYTSPHLVRLNERFCLNGRPVDDVRLERAASRVSECLARHPEWDTTFFEALTGVAFLLLSEARVTTAVLECGLGGRLDATNVCCPELTVITRIGLDHCDWLGETVEKIAAEKAGIIKPGVPVLLGANEPSVRDVVERRARELSAPFFFAPAMASEDEIPSDFSLAGAFNRENAVTALAALKILRRGDPSALARVVWPGRFQRVGAFLIDGAHNPPAARALVDALRVDPEFADRKFTLVAGFCGDKDVGEVLRLLAPLVSRGIAVKTCNPRSLSSAETAERMRAAGIESACARTLSEALETARRMDARVLVCGSLFLAGEALLALGAYPWGDSANIDPSESLHINKKGTR